MKVIRVEQAIFDAGLELAPLSHLGGGAVASFTGIARRDTATNSVVSGMYLEHYPAMTSATLRDLVGEAYGRWDLLGSVLIHRVGYIQIGEPIVLVGTASLHRAAALAACAFLIDRLKTSAPFWKKEFFEDGSTHWVEAKSQDNLRSDIWD